MIDQLTALLDPQAEKKEFYYISHIVDYHVDRMTESQLLTVAAHLIGKANSGENMTDFEKRVYESLRNAGVLHAKPVGVLYNHFQKKVFVLDKNKFRATNALDMTKKDIKQQHDELTVNMDKNPAASVKGGLSRTNQQKINFKTQDQSDGAKNKGGMVCTTKVAGVLKKLIGDEDAAVLARIQLADDKPKAKGTTKAALCDVYELLLRAKGGGTFSRHIVADKQKSKS